LSVFEVARPRLVASFGDLRRVRPAKLKVQFTDDPRTSLKGVIVPAGDCSIVTLSFGISLIDAVRDYSLTSADFSATDLAIELLYLVEAKSAAMDASRTLNTRLQGAMIAAEEQAFTDTLTGLKNRRALDHIFTRLPEQGGYALMNLDLDFFKQVNDTLGHAAGDHVLQQAARIMVEETRSEDTVARTGGDEFVLVFHRLDQVPKLEAIARRLIDRIEQPIPFENDICKISSSIGIAVARSGETPEDVQKNADAALYAAKRAGRACHRVHDPDQCDVE
jgi:diguanylate cyclase (GGDEF)-like protein